MPLSSQRSAKLTSPVLNAHGPSHAVVRNFQARLQPCVPRLRGRHRPMKLTVIVHEAEEGGSGRKCHRSPDAPPRVRHSKNCSRTCMKRSRAVFRSISTRFRRRAQTASSRLRCEGDQRQAVLPIAQDRGKMLKRVAGSHHIYSKIGNPVRISVPAHGHTPLTIDLQRHQKKLSDLAESML